MSGTCCPLPQQRKGPGDQQREFELRLAGLSVMGQC